MSDTQGANLEGDMPGVGTAPPTTGIARSPLQLPSALQGLAKFFTQSQPKQPGSKPSFPPKPPVLTEEQAHQRPQHTGSPASFAPVPPVIPTPTDGFSPYMKAADKRDPSQWGDPVRYPRLPATFEVMPMLHQIGQSFAQAGGDVGQAGADTAYHSAAYWDGFMKARTFKMKQAQEGVALASAQLELAITNRLIDNKNTLDEYTRAAGGDLAKLGSTTIGGVDLRHALWENAIRDGDEPAQRMFEAGLPLDQIINYLHDADKNLRDLRAARAKAGDQEAEDAAAYRLGPKAGEGAGATGWDQTAPQEAGTQPSPEAAAAAAPKDAADTPDWAKGLDPKLVDAAEQHFRGDLHEGENKIVGRKADQLARQMDTEVNKVLDDAHAGRIKPSEVMPAIRKIAGPRIASDAENVGNYSRPGYGSGMGTGGSQRQGDYNQLLDNIARAADPPDVEHGHQGFVANGYALQDNFKKDNQIRTVQDRINSLPADADEIRRDIYALKQSGKYSMNDINWTGIKDQILAGNPDFQKLESDMIAYSTAFQTIQGGGRATLGGTRDVERTFPPQAPLTTYFSVISGHMGDMRGQIRAKHLDWESRGGNPDLMPRGDRTIERRIDDYWKIDRKSGALPYDPKNPDNDSVNKPAGKWGPAGEYYWTGADPYNRDAPKNWKRVE